MTSSQRRNEFGQPVGEALEGWRGAVPPPRSTLEGSYCRLEPLDVDRHLPELYAAYAEDVDGRLWTYMPVGPFDSIAAFRHWMTPACLSDDPLFHAIIESSTQTAVGLAAYMRIRPPVGVIEVGNIAYSPRLQRTPAATEAMFLMMSRVFNDLGYRRYEWKCDALNAASRRAAQRLGFSFDGLFEQAVVYKGRNRDTAWYSILDRDWPALQRAFKTWLAADNFDDDGKQQRPLKDCIEAERVNAGQ